MPNTPERRLFVRERHDGLYRVATYLAAKMLDGERPSCTRFFTAIIKCIARAATCCQRCSIVREQAATAFNNYTSAMPLHCRQENTHTNLHTHKPTHTQTQTCTHNTEIGVACVGSICMSAIVYYGVHLQGSFFIFWMTYFATLCVGIGELLYSCFTQSWCLQCGLKRCALWMTYSASLCVGIGEYNP